MLANVLSDVSIHLVTLSQKINHHVCEHLVAQVAPKKEHLLNSDIENVILEINTNHQVLLTTTVFMLGAYDVQGQVSASS